MSQIEREYRSFRTLHNWSSIALKYWSFVDVACVGAQVKHLRAQEDKLNRDKFSKKTGSETKRSL